MQTTYTLGFKTDRQTKKDCGLSSPQALGTWAGVTYLEPEQAWVPRLDCGGAEGAAEGVQAMWPLPPSVDLDFLFPSAWGHTLQTQGDPPAAKPSLVPPEDGGVSGLEELCKVPWAKCLLLVGFPPPASFLGVAHLRRTAPSAEWCGNRWDVYGGWRLRGKK